jgi:hypothetical protein
MGLRLAGGLDISQDTFKITSDSLVGEAYDPVALRFQFLAAEDVGFGLFMVDAAVDFDHQARRGAVEVDGIGIDGVLTAEFDASQPAVAQAFPQNSFCGCHALAQLFSARLDRGGGADAFGFHWILGSYSFILPANDWRSTPFSPIDGREGGGGK